jgi:ribonuclease III
LDCNKSPGIDLHIHSTASDGSLSPSQILALAQRLKLRAISITDHDTVDGVKDAINYGIPPSINFLTGVEVSAAYPPSCPRPGSFHILGYAFRIDDPVLNHTLDKLRQARKNRNPQIIECLNQLGFPMTFDEVVAESGEGQIGRPHIARLMVAKGYAESIDDAFDQFLGNGKPAYIDKYRVDCAGAIEMIRTAGGIPVLAHPFLLNMGCGEDLEALIVDLVGMGLQGIEAYYPGESAESIAQYIEIANRHDLLVTGGTDFHGAINPNIQMGVGKGDMFIPYGLYKKIANFQVSGENMNIIELEGKLHYHFKDVNLLDKALRHSSYVNEQLDTDLQDNECLEFLGDAVLSLIVGDILMKHHPELREGDLSRMRANLVKESQLSEVALTINLGKYVRLGKGEVQTNGRDKKSILADTFEAVLGAVYLDGGFDAAFGLIEYHFMSLIGSIALAASDTNYKSRLQELVQLTYKEMPGYQVVDESGPDHDKIFKVQVSAHTLMAEGKGRSKKTAEQDAARNALEMLYQQTKTEQADDKDGKDSQIR